MMALAPVANFPPDRVSVATAVTPAVAPDAVRLAVPSTVAPKENVTLPGGATLPLAGVTVTVNTVFAEGAILT